MSLIRLPDSPQNKTRLWRVLLDHEDRISYVDGIRACKFTHTVQVSLIYLKHQLNAGCLCRRAGLCALCFSLTI